MKKYIITIAIILSSTSFAQLAPAPETNTGPVYNFQFFNYPPGTQAPEALSNQVQRGAKQTPAQNAAAVAPEAKTEKEVATKMWGPVIGYFYEGWESKGASADPKPSSEEAIAASGSYANYSGLSFGLKLPLTQNLSVVPQFLVGTRKIKMPNLLSCESGTCIPRRDKFKGVRLDLRHVLPFKPYFALSYGVSGIALQGTTPVKDPKNPTITIDEKFTTRGGGAFLGFKIGNEINLTVEGRADYLTDSTLNDGHVSYGASAGLGIEF